MKVVEYVPGGDIIFCDKCGLCCKMFNKLQLPSEYQLLDDGTGSCKFLKNNLCSIYETRPDLCNSEIMYKKFYNAVYTKEDYEQVLKEQCKKIKLLFGRLD